MVSLTNLRITQMQYWGKLQNYFTVIADVEPNRFTCADDEHQIRG